MIEIQTEPMIMTPLTLYAFCKYTCTDVHKEAAHISNDFIEAAVCTSKHELKNKLNLHTPCSFSFSLGMSASKNLSSVSCC